jgi:hypothetical protein
MSQPMMTHLLRRLLLALSSLFARLRPAGILYCSTSVMRDIPTVDQTARLVTQALSPLAKQAVVFRGNLVITF